MKTRLLRRFAPALLVGALGATACTTAVDDRGIGSDGNSNNGSTDITHLSSDEILLTSGLNTVSDCDALLEQIKNEAIERVGPYGFDGNQYFGPEVDFAIDEEAAFDDEATSESAAPATTIAGGLASADSAESDTAAPTGGGLDRAGEFSGTNNQERDVDEADLVKTDGEKLVIVNQNTIRVIDVTGRTPELTRTIKLPEDVYNGELFLDGDRALIMTTGWTERPFIGRSIESDWYPGSSVGLLYEIDLDAGDVVRTLEFEGSYLSARKIDDSIRIVLTASAERFSFVYPSNDGALDAAEQANRDLIERSTIEQWIPTYRITEGRDVVEQGPLVDCDRVYIPSEFAGFGSLIVITADLDNGFAVDDTVSVFTDAAITYASTDRLVIATPRWATLDESDGLDSNDYATAMHTFDISDPNRADYVASGLVPGHMLSQYSMSEHDGYLRVATTEGVPWFGGEEQSESVVTVLEEEGGVLQPVGQVGGLGRGEQIFAVRFFGTVGYVVTFRQVDPLYVIDLSNPRDPRLLGELKIPGFSSYLHPIGEDYLLGVGTDGDDEGRTFGAAVSLFDVSDLSNPELVSKVLLGEEDNEFGSTTTPVSWDARAFNYWDDTALVPISWYHWDPDRGEEGQGSGVALIDVNDGRLTDIGRVTVPKTRECEGGFIPEEPPAIPVPEEESSDAESSFVDPEEDETEPLQPRFEPDLEEFCWEWAPDVSRTVVVGDDLYSISQGGVLVNDFDSLEPLTWIPFELR